MTKTTQEFMIPFHSHAIKGETLGDITSNKAIIFSHGFGATRYGSRDLLLDIAEMLEEAGYLCVLFDFNEYRDNGKTFIPSLDKQTKILEAVTQYVKNVYKIEEITFVAHSMGCVSAARNSSEAETAILITPPAQGFWWSILNNYVKKFNHISFRNDGGMNLQVNHSPVTVMLDKKFSETLKHSNFDKIYTEANKKTNLYFAEALRDEVIPNMNYTVAKENSKKFLTIDDTHNIPSLKGRGELLEYICEILEISPKVAEKNKTWHHRLHNLFCRTKKGV